MHSMSNEKHLGHRPYRVKGITDSVLDFGGKNGRALIKRVRFDPG